MSDKKVKYYDAIVEIFGLDAEDSLKAIGSTLQTASDEIQQGVDNGYTVEAQVRLVKPLGLLIQQRRSYEK